MVVGEFAAQIPDALFTVIHLLILLVALYAAYAVYQRGDAGAKVGAGFGLLALGEISYIGYHVQITHILFSHTVSEVLVLLAVVLILLAVRDRL